MNKKINIKKSKVFSKKTKNNQKFKNNNLKKLIHANNY